MLMEECLQLRYERGTKSPLATKTMSHLRQALQLEKKMGEKLAQRGLLQQEVFGFKAVNESNENSHLVDTQRSAPDRPTPFDGSKPIRRPHTGLY